MNEDVAGARVVAYVVIVNMAVCLTVAVLIIHWALTSSGADPSPTPAVTVTETQMNPGPTRTTLVPVPGPTVTRKAEASRSRTLYDWIHAFARCVRNHESADAGLYLAENPSSSASGAYQFIDSTWRNYASRLGYSYSRAKYAPPAVQDRVFRLAASESPLHWRGTNCGYGT
jgi:hypothetical protein